MDITSLMLLDDCARSIYSLERLLEQEETGLTDCFQGDLLESHKWVTEGSREQLEKIKRNLRELIPEFPG